MPVLQVDFDGCQGALEGLCWSQVKHHRLMGTRSRIGIELQDHSVVSSYCHWDGYPSGNGRTLVKHYQDRDAVKALIDGGSMSSVRTRNTWNCGSALRDENGEYIHDAEGFMMSEGDREPQPQYHSERGDGMEPMHSSFDQFTKDNCDEEFVYLYSLNGEWKCWELERVKSSAGVWYNKTIRTEIPA